MTLSISFEVFPPKSADGLDGPAADGFPAERSRAGVRVGHVRRRRIGPRTILCGDRCGAIRRVRRGRASHVCRAGTIRHRRRHPSVRRPRESARSLPCVAIRQAGSMRLRTACRRLPDALRIWSRPSSSTATSTSPCSAYPERHPQSPTDGHDLERARREGRRRRGQGDDADVLRQRPASCATAIGCRPVGSTSRSCPASSRSIRSRPSPDSRNGAEHRSRSPIADRFAGLDDDIDKTQVVAAEIAASQIRGLPLTASTQVHIYTLNRADLALAVCQELGVSSKVAAA